MKVTVLINPAAGGIGPDGEMRMRDALGELGLGAASLVTFDHDAAAAQMRALITDAPDLLIVWGGDGTHRTALSTARTGFANLLLLPGGTMNLLTKWLHGHAPWHVTLRAVLAHRATRVLNAGQVGSDLFFCALLAGAPARFAQAREDLRAGDFGRAMRDAGMAVEAAHRLHLTADAGPDAPLPAGNAVAALVGPLSRSSRMDVASLDLPSAVAALSFAWTTLRTQSRPLDGVVLHATDSVTIVDPEGMPVPAIMDGEQVEVGARFTVSYQPEAACCLIAAGTEPGSQPSEAPRG
ncbi:MAG: hypothetical protein EON61_00620 [Alphaproteobacteria bacterium]|nr:MAG: hypothetical protein EON61_00620 [Alphaproteobacteria bacterium]